MYQTELKHVKIYYNASDGVDVHADLRVVKDDGASAWVDLGGSGSASPSGSITSGSFSSFSDFALANVLGGGGNPLPVELLSANPPTPPTETTREARMLL